MSGTSITVPVSVVADLLASRTKSLILEAKQNAAQLDEITQAGLPLDEIMTEVRETDSKIQRTNAIAGHLVILSGFVRGAQELGIETMTLDLESAGALGMKDEAFHARWTEEAVAIVDGAVDRLNKSVQARQNPQQAQPWPGTFPGFPGIEPRNPLFGGEDDDPQLEN